MSEDVFALIVAGGGGTRLWPRSRDALPKQFLSLEKNGSHSLFQQSFLRLSRTIPPAQIYVIAAEAHAELATAQLHALERDWPQAQLLSEPAARNTAPAVLWGLLQLRARNPQALAVIAWADALLCDSSLDAPLAQALKQAHSGRIVLLSCPAHSAKTQLGWMRHAATDAGGTYAVENFVEKPEAAQAQRMLKEGRWVWNCGLFVSPVEALLRRFRSGAATLFEKLEKAYLADAEEGAAPPGPALRTEYPNFADQAIDPLLFERTQDLWTLPCDLEWSDMGAWDAVYAQGPYDAQKNRIQGEVVLQDVHNSLVLGDSRLIAAVGVEGLAIVDSPDALLVCTLQRSAEVREVVQQIRARGFSQTHDFGEAQRPWGGYRVLSEHTGWKVKVLEVRPGQRLSLQAHKRRAEHWVLVEGRARLTLDEEVREYKVGQHLFIPLGARHRIENPGEEVLRIVEVQLGDYLGEDDIQRFEDVYGRT